MLRDFKNFILRGNVVDLAVAVVIGAAFSGIVSSLVKDLITPLIGSIYKAGDFSKSSFTINGSQFMYGDFINALVNFLIIAAVIFFLVVLPVNKLIALNKRNDSPSEPNTKKCPFCISEIPLTATKCSFCTSTLPKTTTR